MTLESNETTRRQMLGSLAAFGTLAGTSYAFGQTNGTTQTIRASTFKGQTYFIGSYFMSRVAPPGVKIELVEVSTSIDALDALLTGNTDAAFIGLIPCILGQARGRPINVVASCGAKGARMVARADSNIKTIKDLAGKNVGVSKTTNHDIILRELLFQAGMDPIKDINTILLPTNAHIEALTSHTVDAVATGEPYGSYLIVSGLGRDIAPDEYNTPVGKVGVVLALSHMTVEEKPALAQQIVTLHAKATVLARKHPEEQLRTLMQISRQKEDVMRLSMTNAELQYDIDDDYKKRSVGVMNELIKAKYLNAPTDLDKLFALQFLAQAKAEAGVVY
jgi:ABC-type nitrate/sulfonate/bicarbonate transport system substrate-binding protein